MSVYQPEVWLPRPKRIVLPRWRSVRDRILAVQPTRVGSGTGVEDTAGAINVTKTGVTVGNLIIVQAMADGDSSLVALTFNDTNNSVESITGTANTMTLLTGHPIKIGVTDPPSAGGSHWLWFGRATATTASIDVTTAGQDTYIRVYEFTNVNTGTTFNDIIENGSAGTAVNEFGNSGTVPDVGVTTLGPDRLALNFIGVNDDSTDAYESFTGETGGDWVLTDQFEAAGGTDGAIFLQVADMPSAGTINGGTMTMDSDPFGVIGFALKPVEEAGPPAAQPPQIIPDVVMARFRS